jgi:hypothetical protein
MFSKAGLPSLLFSPYFIGLLFDPEDGSNTFIRKVNKLQLNYAASRPRRWYSSEISSVRIFKMELTNFNEIIILCRATRSFYTANLFEKIYEILFTLFIEQFIWGPRKNEIRYTLKVITYNTKFN